MYRSLSRFVPTLLLAIVCANAWPVGDDHGDTTADATLLAPTSSITATVDNSNDVDVFRVDLPSAGTLVIDATTGNDSFDFFVQLFDERGFDERRAFLFNGFEKPDGQGVRYEIQLDVGTYFVRIKKNPGLPSIPYNLQTSFFPGAITESPSILDEYGDTPANAMPLLVSLNGASESLSGALLSPTDVDLFRIDVSEAGFLTAETVFIRDFADFVLSSQSVEGLLSDAQGRPIAFNDEAQRVDLEGLEQGKVALFADNSDSIQPGPFRIRLPVQAGSYFLAVRHEDQVGGSPQYYELMVSLGSEPIADDHGNSISDATVIEGTSDVVGAVEFFETCLFGNPPAPDCPQSVFFEAQGELESPGDRDFFRLQVTDRGRLLVSSYSFGFVTDTTGVLRSAGGWEITRDDDQGVADNFLLDQIFDPGVYYLEVGGFDDIHLGAYELDIAFQPSVGQRTEEIRLNLEEPVGQEIASGVGNIRGWAFGPVPIGRVELYLDGMLASVIPYGGSRMDVGNSFPQFVNADKSGFSQAFFYGNLDRELPHSARVLVVDVNGDFNAASAAFGVLSFDEFVFRGVVDLSAASVEVRPPQLLVRNFVLGQGLYDAALEFRTATQGFALASVRRVGDAARSAGRSPGALRAARDAEHSSVRLNIEEPVQGSTYQGVSNIRGWALSAFGIDQIDLFIDGRLTGNIPYGGSRQDVGLSFPQFQDPSDSGFSMAFNYDTLVPGEHNLRVVATATDGSSVEATVDFRTARFDAPFLRDPALVDLSRGSASVVGQRISLRGVGIDGVPHDLQLAFRKATQNFAVVAATPTLGAPVPAIMQPMGDVQIQRGDSVVFAATATGESPPLDFLWDFGDPQVPDATVQNPGPITFVSLGTFKVVLTVTDAAGRVSPEPATVAVTVEDSNRAPTVRIVTPADGSTVTVDSDPIAFEAEASDPDGDPITLTWSFQRIGGGFFQSASEARPTLTFPEEAKGKVEVTVTATDSTGLARTDRIILTVFEPDEGGR